MASEPRTARNDLFQELKPRCVELSQLALRDDGSASNAKSILQSTSKLFTLLETKCRRTDGAFDEKLADYVFFPLSQILRRKQKYTDRLSELTIKCLRICLEYGWRKNLALDLSKQFLILLTFVAGGVPGKEITTVPEEIKVEAYGALAALFQDSSHTPGGAAVFSESGTIPALGHCVAVILAGVTDGASAAMQLEALRALDSVWRCIKDPETLASFLPGTISALTRSLIPTTGSRRTRSFIVGALETMGYVLLSVLSDVQTRNILLEKSSQDAASNENQKTLTPSWLKASTSQITLALANVIKLRNHDSVEVRKALYRFCIDILDHCHDTLADAAPMLVETCMTLSGVDADDDMSDRSTSLVDLASIHSNLSELIKSTVYRWVSSLPRIMQANDESAKNTALGQLSKAHELLNGLKLESSILEDALGTALRDSVTVTMGAPSSPKGVHEAEFDLNSQAALSLATDNVASLSFRPIILAEESQRQTRNQLSNLLVSLGTRESQLRMASDMLEYARRASGPSLISAYWLSSQISDSAAANNADLDEFFESSLTLSDDQEALNEALFSYSLNVLESTNDETIDWRLQATALEVMASSSQRLKQEFRTELIDVLFPITQFLGASNSRLREHAITCLNIISQSCRYKSASDMIVDNADYMVNAISLRLNTFDISLQAPQVLVMMIRLTGPSLLLYLDDVVSSIFAALDNFHGYQKLVEVLFSVLGEIVDAGSKAPQLQLTNGEPVIINHRKLAPVGPNIEAILALIDTKPLSTRKEDLGHEDFPKEPWKSAKTLLDENDAANSVSKDDDEDSSQSPEETEPSTEIAPPPPTKTAVLLRKITSLSQHHLTSSSPLLRLKLLNLITTSSLPLAKNEDTFLPLVNDIWPVVLSRLFDAEPFVVIAACSTLRSLCENCGDFLATRISTTWPDLLSLARKAKIEVSKEKERSGKGKASRGIFSQNNQVWEALVKLLVAIVGYVRISDDEFEDVLEVLGSIAWEREDVKNVLDVINADAVWLAMLEAGKLDKEGMELPVLEGYVFVSVDNIGV